ncbi:peptide ligase PGM1-related protein [Oryzobacter sp. R7]|uniref:peptide ligase PGM1-related protein n=1 Tax=Oryzobacter faecalis TaxID=3388656 RepID=UPI00398D1D54
MGAFERLQERLGDALDANVPGSTVEHVVVALPSYSMSATLLSHYRSRLAALEHRFLLGALQAGRIPGVHVVLVTSRDPGEVVLDYHARLADPHAPEGVRRRLSCLVVPDDSPRGVAAKLLDRPDLLTELRDRIGGRVALVEPWNVTAAEVEVAVALDAPLNGPAPQMWPLGFKSSARRLFREAGVPVPCGEEGVHDGTDVAAAVARMRRSRPDLDRLVVKVDDSGSGDGNRVVSTRDDRGEPLGEAVLAAQVLRGAPDWFLRDLAAGGVVEELVDGPRVTSPSAQVDLLPGGGVRLLATHEQVLGGAQRQEFVGSRFPADSAYAADLARHVSAVARLLARAGAVGRLAVDFVAVEDAGGWRLNALDLNLRKGGTSHSFAALRHLVPGCYDADRGRWVAEHDGGPRCYRSSDGVVDPVWLGLDPGRAIEAVADAGLAFDHEQGVGVVLHMMAALAVEGRVGVTAIGRTVDEADRLFAAVPDALRAAARRPGSRTR